MHHYNSSSIQIHLILILQLQHFRSLCPETKGRKKISIGQQLVTGSEYVNIFVLIKRSLQSFKCPENLSKIYAEMRKIMNRLEEKKKENKNSTRSRCEQLGGLPSDFGAIRVNSGRKSSMSYQNIYQLLISANTHTSKGAIKTAGLLSMAYNRTQV